MAVTPASQRQELAEDASKKLSASLGRGRRMPFASTQMQALDKRECDFQEMVIAHILGRRAEYGGLSCLKFGW
jgi:hypothetical protein